MHKWNDKWTEDLKCSNYDCWLRLAECRNKASDIKIMFKLMCKHNPDKTKRDCLDRLVDWVCDWNSQLELFDYVESHYESIVKC